jgi:hypothetical protein
MTLEAALIMPLIMLLTVLAVLMLLYFYEKSAVYSLAASTAERIAYTWDNSAKSARTGAHSIERYDSLYWRLTDDNWMNLVQNALPNRKFDKTSLLIPTGQSVTSRYDHSVVHRKVHIGISSMFNTSLVSAFLGKREVSAEAASHVIEPVEFIRNIRLVQSYWPFVQDKLEQLRGRSSVGKKDQERESSTKEKKKKLLEFRYERDARVYLKEQVRGIEKDVKLPDGRLRKLDAVDPDGVVHQAYVGYMSNRFVTLENGDEVSGQADKDGVLLRSGQARAVVWHFYRRTGSDKLGPSKPLLRELERQGILVIIHDEEYVEVEEE